MSEKVLGTIKVERGGDFGRSFHEILLLRPDGVTVARMKRGRLSGGLVIITWIISLILMMAIGSYAGEAADWFLIVGTVFVPVVYLVYFIFDVMQSRKKEKEYAELSPEDILKADKNNFTIFDSEILEAELYYPLKPYWIRPPRISPRLRIILHAPLPERGVRDDYILWLLPKVKHHELTSCLENYRSLLRSVFGDKLSGRRYQ